MSRKYEKQIEGELKATGLPFAFDRGTKHIKVVLAGTLVGILPRGKTIRESDGRAFMNLRSQIRRLARDMGANHANGG